LGLWWGGVVWGYGGGKEGEMGKETEMRWRRKMAGGLGG
jgi:hypothetical protein